MQQAYSTTLIIGDPVSCGSLFEAWKTAKAAFERAAKRDGLVPVHGMFLCFAEPALTGPAVVHFYGWAR